MHRVLLHLIELETLENVAKETVVGLFQAVEVVHEDVILCLKHLDFSQCKGRIKTVLNLVEIEHIPIDTLNVQVFDHVSQVVFADRHRVGRKHTVVHVRVRLLLLDHLGCTHLLLDLVVYFIADH